MNIDGHTKLLGLLGWPVSHSLSPVMHNAAAEALGVNAAYLPLPVKPEQLPEAVRGLVALGIAGVNVTVPHKETVMPFLDSLANEATVIGAVNTIAVNQNGRLEGFNTDWSGFLADLAAIDLPLLDRDCLILGAGGSARAIVYALLQVGSRVNVLARRREQTQALVTDMSSHFTGRPSAIAGLLTDLPQTISDLHAPLIVNTTPLGMIPNDHLSPWPDDLPFPRDAFVYDIVYNPAETRFLSQAQAAGCRTANGLGMLVHQAAQAFTLWTGLEPDVSLMRQVAEAALAAPPEGKS